MRQGQHNKRARGRNRKGPNPLNRTYESSGPDVKIRGTAATIAEKYMSLARDAQSSGDSVAAENYLQHAEHYNRIIAASQAQAQAAQQEQQAQANGAQHNDASNADNASAENNGSTEPNGRVTSSPSEADDGDAFGGAMPEFLVGKDNAASEDTVENGKADTPEAASDEPAPKPSRRRRTPRRRAAEAASSDAQPDAQNDDAVAEPSKSNGAHAAPEGNPEPTTDVEPGPAPEPTTAMDGGEEEPRADA